MSLSHYFRGRRGFIHAEFIVGLYFPAINLTCTPLNDFSDALHTSICYHTYQTTIKGTCKTLRWHSKWDLYFDICECDAPTLSLLHSASCRILFLPTNCINISSGSHLHWWHFNIATFRQRKLLDKNSCYNFNTCRQWATAFCF